MSYATAFLRDLEVLCQIRERVNVLPLGSGALAGTPFKIDRNVLAQDLGFHSISLNSMDATGNRDFVGNTAHVFSNHVINTQFFWLF